MTNRPKSEPGRRTRQRILDTTLALYNERGEPQVSTSLIATELGISAGNLHYHFRRKDELSAALLERFVSEFDGYCRLPDGAQTTSKTPGSSCTSCSRRCGATVSCSGTFRE